MADNTNMNESKSLYTRIGGKNVLREFVNHLYDFMDSTPGVEHIRSMHSDSLSHARERLFMFLSGMSGGPPLYMDNFGPPRLRRKHLYFDIGDRERDQWLSCAQYAADQLKISQPLREELMLDLTVMANHLRNNDEDTNTCLNERSA